MSFNNSSTLCSVFIFAAHVPFVTGWLERMNPGNNVFCVFFHRFPIFESVLKTNSKWPRSFYISHNFPYHFCVSNPDIFEILWVSKKMEIAGRVEAAEGAVASLWQQLGYGIPSRKLTVCYGKSPCLIGKSTIYGKWDYNVDHVEVIVDMIMWMTGYNGG